MRKTILLCLSLLAAGLFCSCKMPAAGDSHPSRDAAKTGGLSIQIPSIAPWLQPLVDRASGAKSIEHRAYLFATEAVIELLSGTNLVIPAITLVPSVTEPSGILNLATMENIPAGTGYTLRVSIYNDRSYAGGSKPIASGSASIDIAEGQTTRASVVCLPTLTYTTGDFYTKNYLSKKNEMWYRINTTPHESVSISQSNENFPTFLFDVAGELKATITSASGAYSFTENSLNGSIYYLGTAALASGNNGLSVVRNRAVPANEGSMETPVHLLVDGPDRPFVLGAAIMPDNTSYYSFTTNPVDRVYYFTSYMNYSQTHTLYDGKNFSFYISPAKSSRYKGAEYSWVLTPSTTYYLSIENQEEYSIDRYDLPVSFKARIIGETEAIRLGRQPVPRRIAIDTPQKLNGNGHLYADDEFTFTASQDSATAYYLRLASQNQKASYSFNYSNPDGTTYSDYFNSDREKPIGCAMPGLEIQLRISARSSSGEPTYLADLGSATLISFTAAPRSVSLGKTVLEWEGMNPVEKLTFPSIAGKGYRVHLLDHAQYNDPYGADLLMAVYDASGKSYAGFMDRTSGGYPEQRPPTFVARDSSTSIILRLKDLDRGKNYGVLIEEVSGGGIDVEIE